MRAFELGISPRLLESDDYRPTRLPFVPSRGRYESIQDWMAHIVPKLAEYWGEHCRQWLDESGGRKIWRGIHWPHDASPVFTRAVRLDRAPKDSSPKLHQFFNDLIAATGGSANRTNSAFVSGSRSIAADYGTSFVVLPVGPYNYTWSPILRDWYSVLGPNQTNAAANAATVMGKWIDRDAVIESDEIMSPYLAHPGLSQMDFGDALREMIRHEVVDLRDIRYMDPAKVKKDILADQQLREAINSGNEIMVKASTMLFMSQSVYDAVMDHYVNEVL